jgi:hypothetical protein
MPHFTLALLNVSPDALELMLRNPGLSQLIYSGRVSKTETSPHAPPFIDSGLHQTLLLAVVEGMTAKYLCKEPTTGQIRSEAVRRPCDM